MANFRLLIPFLLLTSCGIIYNEDQIRVADLSSATWITDGTNLPTEDSLFYLNRPAPLFRKGFNVHKKVKRAMLSITSAGYYLAFINGVKIGKIALDPAWTDYSKRVYYSDFDVTAMLAEEGNCLGVTLGNGFYNPLPLRKWGHRNLRVDTKVGKPAFIAALNIEYEDGEFETIMSDTTWKYEYGPLIRNSVYLGVIYDARDELEGWSTPGYDDKSWKVVQLGTAPGGNIQKAFFPSVQVTEELSPVNISTSGQGVWLIDMGVNFTGTYKIKVSGNKGDTIVFKFGERVYKDGSLNPMTTVIGQIKKKGKGGPGSPDIAWQTDSYIKGSNDDEWFIPEFTYHTYRFMEIAGLKQEPSMSDVKGLMIHSNVKNINSFSSSSDLLNSIQQATERTFLSNLVSVQSDCPAREKFGYGGDLNATSESFIYNFDMQSFYQKTIYDWVDAMNDSSFVDTAPFTGIKYCGISWESAYLTTQYYLYLYYGDTEIIKELYEKNLQWMEKVARIHPDGMVEEGLSDHESLEPVPVQLTGTSHYLQCARIMETFAREMGDTENEEKYENLANKLKIIIKNKFWDQPVNEKINRQTLFATLLYHGIIPTNEIVAARDSLLLAVSNAQSGHFTTGIFGTKYVLETLSQVSTPNNVYEIVNSTSYPGWGFMIDQGATTIWETWKESDNTYSNNHPMFGTVTEWFYRWLAGIRPDPDYPGFKRFTLAPSTPDGLEFVNCIYYSPNGPIISNWMKHLNGDYQYDFTIPEGSIGNVILQISANNELTIEGRSTHIIGLQSGKFKLEEGQYTIVVSSRNESEKNKKKVEVIIDLNPKVIR